MNLMHQITQDLISQTSLTVKSIAISIILRRNNIQLQYTIAIEVTKITK
jgi:hypothetical protein